MAATALVVPASRLNLGTKGRTVFAAVYVLVQVVLIATVPMRPDKTFAFQMFNESSTLAISLSRRVRGPGGIVRDLPISGRWEANDGNGVRHTFDWNDRVRDPIVGTLGRPVHAAYGIDAQLSHLQGALDDVMAHLDRDVETTALVADVEIRRNGRGPTHVRLLSSLGGTPPPPPPTAPLGSR
jgi:hypothetical protein